MTISGSTAEDAKLSLEKFTGSTKFEKLAENTAAQSEALQSETKSDAPVATIVAAPANSPEKKPADPDEAAVVVAVPSDRPIEIPQQTKIEPVLAPVVAAQPTPLPPRPKPVVHRSREEMCEAVVQAAHRNDLPIPYFIRLLFQESGFRPDVVSHAGAQGVAQFMPETAASVGLKNPFDPLEAIPASARLLRSLFQQFGNLGLAAAAYNAGPRRIENWLSRKGSLPQETQGYVKIITGRPAENWKTAEAGTPQIKLPRRAPCQEVAGLQAWNGPDRIPMPVPSPRTRTAEVSSGTPASAPIHGVTRVFHVAAMMKTAKTVTHPATSATTKAPGKKPVMVAATQMAARKAVPAKKATHGIKIAILAPEPKHAGTKPAVKPVAKMAKAVAKPAAKPAGRPVRLAVANHTPRK